MDRVEHTKWILTQLCRNLDALSAAAQIRRDTNSSDSAAAQIRRDTNSSDGPFLTDIAVNLNSAKLTIMELLDETGRLDEYNDRMKGMG